MQVLVAALAFAALAAAEDADKPQVDYGAVQMQLGSMMTAANRVLSKAEKHHEKVVDKARTDLADAFDDEGELAGDAVKQYEADLVGLEARLQAAINASKLGVARASEVPNSSGWDSPLFMQKAKVTAQQSAAERTLKHLRRMRASLVHSAENQVEAPFEDVTMHLGLMLGDLSESMKEAKEKIEGIVEYVEESGNLTRDALAALPKAAAPRAGKTVAEEQARLSALEKDLVTAQTGSKVGAERALVKLEKAIANETATLKAQSEKVSRAINDAQHTEVSAVGRIGKKQVAKLEAMAKKAPKVAARKGAAEAARSGAGRGAKLVAMKNDARKATLRTHRPDRAVIPGKETHKIVVAKKTLQTHRAAVEN